MERVHPPHDTPGRRMSPFDVTWPPTPAIRSSCRTARSAGGHAAHPGHDLLARPEGREANRHLHRRSRPLAGGRHAGAIEGVDGRALHGVLAGRPERLVHHRCRLDRVCRGVTAAPSRPRSGRAAHRHCRRHGPGGPCRRRDRGKRRRRGLAVESQRHRCGRSSCARDRQALRRQPARPCR